MKKTMRNFVANFKNINEDRLNMQLINHDYEENIVDFIVAVFKSLETIPYITFLNYEVEYDESKIPYYRFVNSRRKTKKKDKKIRYHYIKPDRACLLTMAFMIKVKGAEPKIVHKKVLIPTFDDNKYLTLKGNKYFLLYQLVDSSTYVSKNGLTLKSLMPIIINYRDRLTKLVDTDGNEYNVVTYFMKVFKRNISLLLFFFCRMGFSTGIKYFVGSYDVFRVVLANTKTDHDYWIRFPINKKIHLLVDRKLFAELVSIQTLTGMLMEVFTSKTSMENLDSKDYWLEQLGSLYTATKYKKIESGKSTMLFFERLLDLTTKNKLKVNEINKLSIYAITSWLTLDFVKLRQKNNMNLQTKRLRLNEYIASLLNLKLGDSINRVLAYGNKASIRQIETNLFKFPATIIITILSSNPLIKYDARVNDCDFISKLQYTVKGPNSLGSGKSERNIGVRYRGTSVSYLGNIDINVYSSSSPGLNGSLTPFAETSGLYFNKEPEPQDEKYIIAKHKQEEDEKNGILTPNIGDDSISYYDALMKAKKDLFYNSKIIEHKDPGVLYVGIDDDSLDQLI